MANLERQVQLEYRYYLDNDLGNIGMINLVNISVDSQTLVSDGHDYNLYHNLYALNISLDHKNYLKGYFIDYANNNIAYQNFTTTLENYDVNLVRRYRVFVHENQRTANLSRITYNYIPREYRNFFHGMINFIFYIHSRGICLDRLELKNLVIKDQQLKFFGLKFVDTNPFLEARDFTFVSNVIRQLFQVKGFAIPYDMDNLLVQLNDYHNNGTAATLRMYREFFLDHLAILSYTDRVNLINFGNRENLLWDVVKSVSVKNSMKTYLGEAGINLVGWKQRIKRNRNWGPFLNCLNYNGTIPPYDDRTEDLAIHNMLRFCRNFGAHSEGYVDADLTIMAAFHRELVLYQQYVFVR